MQSIEVFLISIYLKVALILMTMLISCNPHALACALCDNNISHWDYQEDVMREAKVAGMFYSADKTELIKQVDEFINVNVPVTTEADRLIGIMAPHAGYTYSGAMAGKAYSWLKSSNASRVILLGISHQVPFKGFSVFNGKAYNTPVGYAFNDLELAEKIGDKLSNSEKTPDDHDTNEHSLEVQIPFIQRTFPEARIIPVMAGIVGPADIARAATLLSELLKEHDDLVIVASTDMSHFHDLKTAESLDKPALDLIGAMEIDELARRIDSGSAEMCGIIPVMVLMETVAILRGSAIVLGYGTSADASGDSNRVVGYGAAGFYLKKAGEDSMKEKRDTTSALSQEVKDGLLKLARDSIETRFSEEIPVYNPVDEVKGIQGAFVTLHKDGELRGCIGNIIGRMPLWETVKEMARAAAFGDPRFRPLNQSELDDVDIEISAMSELKQVSGPDEIEIGIHGVLIVKGGYQAVFLPQVAVEQEWDRDTTLQNLCMKAGLPQDEWQRPGMEFHVFTAEVFGERESEN